MKPSRLSSLLFTLFLLAGAVTTTGCTQRDFSLNKIFKGSGSSASSELASASVNPCRPPLPDIDRGDNSAFRATEALLDIMNEMAEELTGSLGKNFFPGQFRVILTTFTNVNNFSETNQFGRSAAENLMTALNHQGYKVVETRISANLLIDNTGEFMLTRRVKELANNFKANSVLVGTFSHINKHSLGLNIRLIRTSDQQVMAAAARTLSLDEYPQLREMLKKDSSAELQYYGIQTHQ